MSSERELDEGIRSIKSAWRREHTARANLESMLEQAEAENTKLQELMQDMHTCIKHACLCDFCPLFVAEDMDETRCIADMDSRMRELGVEVDV